MTYITSLGITNMTNQQSVGQYRSIAGALPTLVSSGIHTSYIMPLEGNLNIDVNYENFRSFEIKQAFTLYSGFLAGDEIHISSGIWDVRVVENWYLPDFYHLILEEVK